mmetsp:Transcript_8404/g.15267  ORF Transcript_8404/g.15267 Transcript_8404/m.15267 type:complete len:247 (-) Transcript_8404:209-949(-)
MGPRLYQREGLSASESFSRNAFLNRIFLLLLLLVLPLHLALFRDEGVLSEHCLQVRLQLRNLHEGGVALRILPNLRQGLFNVFHQLGQEGGVCSAVARFYNIFDVVLEASQIVHHNLYQTLLFVLLRLAGRLAASRFEGLLNLLLNLVLEVPNLPRRGVEVLPERFEVPEGVLDLLLVGVKPFLHSHHALLESRELKLQTFHRHMLLLVHLKLQSSHLKLEVTNRLLDRRHSVPDALRGVDTGLGH